MPPWPPGGPRARTGAEFVRRKTARPRRSPRNWRGGEQVGRRHRGKRAELRPSFEPPVRRDEVSERETSRSARPREFEGAPSSVPPAREKRSVGPVSWLPDLSPSGSFPNAQPISRSETFSGLLPGASPVTVAGAARDLHPLPYEPRFARIRPNESQRSRTSGDDTPASDSYARSRDSGRGT